MIEWWSPLKWSAFDRTRSKFDVATRAAARRVLKNAKRVRSKLARARSFGATSETEERRSKNRSDGRPPGGFVGRR